MLAVNMFSRASILLAGVFLDVGLATAERSSGQKLQHAFEKQAQQPLVVDAQEPSSRPGRLIDGQPGSALRDLRDALDTMQSQFFALWLGTWPNAIDWTAAVMQTHVSASLTSISHAFNYSVSDPLSPSLLTVENDINKFFMQTTAYYFGQDAFGIRQQAHDDMLWVVLGWLEAIELADTHDRLHHQIQKPLYGYGNNSGTWFGTQFSSALAHRAHVFYDIVHRAWDKELCGGGLTWDPQLETYKNTVTNTQFISAAVQMYMRHPGDANSSPFFSGDNPSAGFDKKDWGLPVLQPHDPKLLHRAIEAYNWLQAVELLDANGLYVDGYHISPGNRHNHSATPDQCDIRNEMLYTYNQGIVLSGLRNLWEATGNESYLIDGHRLVGNVIRATGWRDRIKGWGQSDQLPISRDDISKWIGERDQDVPADGGKPGRYKWHPLGRAGILEEFCDPSGYCSQDGQTFKGIFFHHLTSFCRPLPTKSSDFDFIPGISHKASSLTAKYHSSICKEYSKWVATNARAAWTTRNGKGIMGSWWSVNVPNHLDEQDNENERHLPESAVDVRNEPIPLNDRWRKPSSYSGQKQNFQLGNRNTKRDQRQNSGHHHEKPSQSTNPNSDGGDEVPDQNDRGRGRTVESHASGLAVIRCLWELSKLLDD